MQFELCKVYLTLYHILTRKQFWKWPWISSWSFGTAIVHRRCEFPSRTRCSQVAVLSLSSPSRVDTGQVGRPKFDIVPLKNKVEESHVAMGVRHISTAFFFRYLSKAWHFIHHLWRKRLQKVSNFTEMSPMTNFRFPAYKNLFKVSEELNRSRKF